VVAVHGCSALWGLLAVGLLSGGSAGAGWNGVGESAYLEVAGQGVSGRWVAAGWVADWPGQFHAQAFGVAALAALSLIAGGLLMGLARGLVRAWHGENVPRRVARSGRRLRLPRVRLSVPAWLRKRAPRLAREDVDQEPAHSFDGARFDGAPASDAEEDAIQAADSDIAPDGALPDPPGAAPGETDDRNASDEPEIGGAR
jgi:hypothetical protein